MSRVVRHRAGGDGERDVPRERQPAEARRAARQSRCELTEMHDDMPLTAFRTQRRWIPAFAGTTAPLSSFPRRRESSVLTFTRFRRCDAKHQTADDLSGHGNVAHARRLSRARRLRDARKGAARDVVAGRDREDHRFGYPGARRRGVSDGPEMGGGQSERRDPALPLRQCRRGRARHVQGSLDTRERAASCCSNRC